MKELKLLRKNVTQFGKVVKFQTFVTKNVGTYSEKILDKEIAYLVSQISSEKLREKLENIIENKRALKRWIKKQDATPRLILISI